MKRKTSISKIASILVALAFVWGGVACTQPETPAPTTYKITFDSGVESISVEEGAVAKEPTKPTKDGYEFIEWLNGTEAYDWTLPVTSNLSLTAKWSAIKYTITYLPDGVKTDNPTTYTIESETITLKEPTLEEGKYFIAWHVDTEEGKVETEIAKGSTGNKTFYAEISSEKPCVVTFNDGTKVLASVNTKKDSKVTLPTGYEKYNFFSDKECTKAFDITTPITADTTIYVKVKTFTVTFDSGVEAVTVEYEGTVKEPTAPTNGDKVFVGWYDGDKKFDFTTKITKDITLKAKWEEKKVEEISSFVNVTKDGDVYSFADGTYQFIEEDGNSILKIGMPDGTEFKTGDTIKITGTINFGEDTPYKQCFMQTLDEAGIAMFGWDMIQVAVWDGGRLNGDVTVNKSNVIANDYAPKYCKFQMGALYDGEKAMYPTVILKDVKITHYPYVEGSFDGNVDLTKLTGYDATENGIVKDFGEAVKSYNTVAEFNLSDLGYNDEGLGFSKIAVIADVYDANGAKYDLVSDYTARLVLAINGTDVNYNAGVGDQFADFSGASDKLTVKVKDKPVTKVVITGIKFSM